jgi:hypothetical protein
MNTVVAGLLTQRALDLPADRQATAAPPVGVRLLTALV